MGRVSAHQLLLFAVLLTAISAKVAADPVAWWKFGGSEGKTAVDSASGIEDEILGNFKYVQGTSGDALRFDGYSTAVRREAKSAPELGKSWLRAPILELKGSGYTSEGYDPAESVYLLTRENTNQPKPLRIKLAASEDHPVVNPAFIIKDWGDANATLKIDGEAVERGASFRFGHRAEPTRTDLIVWLKLESVKPVEIAFEPLAR